MEQTMNDRRFLEFFAGGGMARAGLGVGWRCVFANDFCAMKAATYERNWNDRVLCADVNTVTAGHIVDSADLAWASFPCQDVSLAGAARGLGSEGEPTRSGSFWAFWRIMEELKALGRAPPLIMLENVYGVLTANDGFDFAFLCRTMMLSGYRVGAVLFDAATVVPQSRPRVFILAVDREWRLPGTLLSNVPKTPCHPAAMVAAVRRLSEVDQRSWFWLNPPAPDTKVASLADLMEDDPLDAPWNDEQVTNRLIESMNQSSRTRLRFMLELEGRQVGSVYRRTRIDAAGRRRARAELRFDGRAGCLRTPSGGSSRQTLLMTEGGSVRTRLLSRREAARLMGLPDTYVLPDRYSDAYHLAGDGVVVPVVRHLAATVLEPIVDHNRCTLLLAAE